MFFCDIALSLLLREKYEVIPANNKMIALSESRKFLQIDCGGVNWPGNKVRPSKNAQVSMAAFTCMYECISRLILSRTNGPYISRLMMYIFVDSCWVLNVFYHPQFIPVWATILLSSLPLEVKTRKLLSQWPAVMINLASWVTVNRWDDTCKSGVNGPAIRRRNLQWKRKQIVII